MKIHAMTLTDRMGRAERDDLALIATRMILEAEAGSHVSMTIRPATGAPAERCGFAYSSPAARSHAEEKFAAGQRHAARGEGKCPEGPPLDVLMFWLGDTQERQRLEIEAAHDAIPDSLAPKRDTTTTTAHLSDRIAQLVATLSLEKAS